MRGRKRQNWNKIENDKEFLRNNPQGPDVRVCAAAGQARALGVLAMPAMSSGPGEGGCHMLPTAQAVRSAPSAQHGAALCRVTGNVPVAFPLTPHLP